jgi:formamidopyrimidine-DNA glycosylase
VPELPEVETVRAGLARLVVDRRIADVAVGHPRAIRRHLAGPADFTTRLTGARIEAASRRGKYLWLPLRTADGSSGQALVAHLGMSGQFRVQPQGAPDERHLHVRIRFTDGGPELRFIDQRTFGGLMLDQLVPCADGSVEELPAQVAHIARDPVDPRFDDGLFVRRLRARQTELKRALLDQSLVSGIGNIYADESLWRAKLSGLRLTSTLTAPAALRLLASVRDVLGAALAAGGTSFDALYVNVNGESGYFDRSLAVYGQAGRACPRCGAAIRRAAFMNRSSFTCPKCQPAPRARSATESIDGSSQKRSSRKM